MRVLVCGGRHFNDTKFVHSTLDRLHKQFLFEVLIEGDADGADRLSGLWADRMGIEHLKFPADWITHGRRAGMLRNKQMLDEGYPQMVVVFPGGKGTANMTKLANEAGVPVHYFEPENYEGYPQYAD